MVIPVPKHSEKHKEFYLTSSTPAITPAHQLITNTYARHQAGERGTLGIREVLIHPVPAPAPAMIQTLGIYLRDVDISYGRQVINTLRLAYFPLLVVNERNLLLAYGIYNT